MGGVGRRLGLAGIGAALAVAAVLWSTGVANAGSGFVLRIEWPHGGAKVTRGEPVRLLRGHRIGRVTAIAKRARYDLITATLARNPKLSRASDVFTCDGVLVIVPGPAAAPPLTSGGVLGGAQVDPGCPRRP